MLDARHEIIVFRMLPAQLFPKLENLWTKFFHEFQPRLLCHAEILHRWSLCD